jgi:phenylacetate-CoA ligase
MLFGYPSSLALIARHAEANGEPMDQLGIRVAFVTSELLYDHQCADIERIFGCPVANGYGGRDAGFIAHACPDGGLHITSEDIVVEVIDSAGNPVPTGTTGELVITHLATGDFPFLRYRTGDIGAIGNAGCPCGRGLPVLQQLEGRNTDFIVAQDGTVMHGLALIYVLREIVSIEEFKIIQESLSHTRVLLRTEGPLSANVSATIVEKLKQRLGDGVTVEIEEVKEMPKERSGKFRYVVSHVDANHTRARRVS